MGGADDTGTGSMASQGKGGAVVAEPAGGPLSVAAARGGRASRAGPKISDRQKEATLNGPHQGQPVRTAGVPLDRASAAMVMVHGRGATAEDILTLVPVLDMSGFAYLAPQARGNSWYPQSFLAPVESNEPGISSGMHAIADVLSRVTAAGIPPERTMLLGFSQGACLTLEFAARHARRYGGIAGLSGGLIGPDGRPRNYAGSLEGTPVFLGCSDVDSHIPAQRVRETAEVLRVLGAEVTMRLYRGMGHLINEDEIAAVRKLSLASLRDGIPAKTGTVSRS